MQCHGVSEEAGLHEGGRVLLGLSAGAFQSGHGSFCVHVPQGAAGERYPRFLSCRWALAEGSGQVYGLGPAAFGAYSPLHEHFARAWGSFMRSSWLAEGA